MTAMRALGVVAILCIVGEAPAQVPFVYGSPGGIGFGYSSRRLSAGIYLGGYDPRLYVPHAYYGEYPFISRYSSVTIYTAPPPPPRIVIVPYPVPVETAPPPTVELRDEDFPDKIIIRPRQKLVRPGPRDEVEAMPDRPLPGEPAGKFRPLLPEDRDQAKQPMAAEEEPPRKPWLPLVPPDVDRPVPQPPDPNGPLAVQQFDLGKQAFIDPRKEYARAERRFKLAIEANPKDALPWFYLAQAQFALGKYRESVAAIHAGLKLRPDWPLSRFNVRELYGPHGDDLTVQLQALQELLQKTPNDPVLLFLYAYQLWFDGRRDEARPLFQRAVPLVAQPRFIDLFLKAHDGPIVRR